MGGVPNGPALRARHLPVVVHPGTNDRIELTPALGHAVRSDATKSHGHADFSQSSLPQQILLPELAFTSKMWRHAKPQLPSLRTPVRHLESVAVRVIVAHW
jgi:hypothetical protein